MPLPFDLGSIGQSATQIAVGLLQKAWVALDPRNRTLAQAIDDGLARASARAWSQSSSNKAGLSSSLADGAADLRALVVAMGITRSVLLDPNRKGTSQDGYVADVLATTWILVAKRGGFTGESVDVTKKKSSTAELALIEVLAVIVAAALVAAVAAFLIYATAHVIETALADNVENDELLRLHAEAQKMIDNHIAQEKAAGHPLPYTSDELQILKDLQDAQQNITKLVQPPPPIEPPGPSKGGWNVALVLLAAGVVGAGYLYLRPHRG